MKNYQQNAKECFSQDCGRTTDVHCQPVYQHYINTERDSSGCEKGDDRALIMTKCRAV
ncbi:hypothetical protein E2C01_056570 [Portunus trituberculatus]|uniref:Uncharacterized protein n=1 Tax=Portunus trituberculatus TaxID=210409 RepID=A0A5B7H0X0_PORTR|nr:hypothetical protein [Portunus trituberculatus]